MPEPIDTSKLGPIHIMSARPKLTTIIRQLHSFKANGNPDDYLAGISVAQAHQLGNTLEELRAAMQEFVDRVDKGEVRSKRTYAKFKELLGVE